MNRIIRELNESINELQCTVALYEMAIDSVEKHEEMRDNMRMRCLRDMLSSFKQHADDISVLATALGKRLGTHSAAAHDVSAGVGGDAPLPNGGAA